MSGVSAGGGSADPILDNLAILADPAKFQERLNALQKATLESTEAWTRIRKAETADAMMRDAEKILADAKASAQATLQEAEKVRTQADADAALKLSNAKTSADSIVEKAKAEAERLRASAKAAHESAAAKEAKANEVVKDAEALKTDIEERQAALMSAQISVADREAVVKAREAEVEQKVQALAGMASILNVR